MGNAVCCPTNKDRPIGAEDVVVSDLPAMGKCPVVQVPGIAGGVPAVMVDGTYTVVLKKTPAERSLGLDINTKELERRRVMTIVGASKSLAKAWNNSASEDKRIREGDSILEVNGSRGKNAKELLERCKESDEVTLLIARSFSFAHLVADIERLVTTKQCGPILVRLSWHDAGVFMKGKGGCPNAAMRFTDGGEGTWDANAGLPSVAVQLLGPITRKYVPNLVSHADLWALAANVSIRVMGGPHIPTRFGRPDVEASSKGCSANDGRLPDASQGADHLRAIFEPKGFTDRDIVALSGAHTIGKCHVERSGFDGAWTEDHLSFDNTYFTEMLAKEYTEETTSAGKKQFRHKASNCMMLPSDLALLKDPIFKKHVEEYAKDQDKFFADFSAAWVKLQENGVESSLRSTL